MKRVAIICVAVIMLAGVGQATATTDADLQADLRGTWVNAFPTNHVVPIFGTVEWINVTFATNGTVVWTWIRDGKTLAKTPVNYGGVWGDTIIIDIDVSEVFIPISWKNRRHIRIALHPTRRGNASLVSGVLHKELIYLLKIIQGGYTPSGDQCQPAVSLDQREAIMLELSKKQNGK